MTDPALRRAEGRDGEVGEQAIAFTLTRPVDPAQLDAELTARMEWSQPAGLVTDGNPTAASPQDPVTLWVLNPEDATFADVLAEVVGAHQVTPPPEDPIEALRAKAVEGGKFTAAEVQEALRYLLTRP